MYVYIYIYIYKYIYTYIYIYIYIYIWGEPGLASGARPRPGAATAPGTPST